jgi:hypothetical protein
VLGLRAFLVKLFWLNKNKLPAFQGMGHLKNSLLNQNGVNQEVGKAKHIAIEKNICWRVHFICCSMGLNIENGYAKVKLSSSD